MRWITLRGKVVDAPTAQYRVDFDGEQGSQFSAEVLDWLYPYWKADVVLAEWPVPGTRMRFDYVNVSKRIITEVDGRQHSSYVPFMAGSRSGYLSQIKRDLQKDEVAKLNGFKMVRINPGDLPLTKEWFLETYDVTL